MLGFFSACAQNMRANRGLAALSGRNWISSLQRHRASVCLHKMQRESQRGSRRGWENRR